MKGIRHILKAYNELPEAERRRIRKQCAEEKMRTGPARSTSSVSNMCDMNRSTSCLVVVSDEMEFMTATVR